ncbi:MAG: phosphohydrolase, partial [Flavobacteriales bacterium]
KAEFMAEASVLDQFCRLDDFDIYTSIKVWCEHSDPVLSYLCKSLVNRSLFRIQLNDHPFESGAREDIIVKAAKHFNLSKEDAAYFVIQDQIDNKAYNTAAQSIMIKYKDGRLQDVASASDHLNLSALSALVEKYFICYPKELVI